MIGTSSAFTVDFRMRKFFLDQERIEQRIGKLKAKTLTRGGSFTRNAARKLLGKQTQRDPRPPGKPPRVRTSDERVSLRNILYYYNAVSDSVIIGPVGLNQVNLTADGSATVPEIQEFGLTVGIHEQQYKVHLGKYVTPSQLRAAAEQPWRRADLRRGRRPWFRYRVRQAHYPARPFMGPALKNTLRRVPDLFGSSSIGEAA